jgi:superfamily I DNA/RNA helicase
MYLRSVRLLVTDLFLNLLQQKKKHHKKSDFLSYELAFKHLKNQTQITFLHLNTTKDLNTSLKVVDPLGIPYFLDADKTAFYIQKKATPLLEHLRLSSSQESKLLIKNLLELFQSTCDTGLQIRDLGPKNIGIYNNTPIWLDLGKIREFPSLPVEKKKEFEHFYRQCSPHLHSFDPTLSSVFKEELERYH